MKKIIIINIVLLFIGIDLFSQSKLFIPNEFINAYKANTRSKTGVPGDNYFINYSDYTIKATFDSETRNNFVQHTLYEVIRGSK